MRKCVKQFIVSLVAVTAIIASVVSAHALVTATRHNASLDFSGTTARCHASVIDPGKTITVTAQLWRGTTLVASWMDRGVSFVEVDGKTTAQVGQTYTLRVSYKINGITYRLPDIEKICLQDTV